MNGSRMEEGIEATRGGEFHAKGERESKAWDEHMPVAGELGSLLVMKKMMSMRYASQSMAISSAFLNTPRQHLDNVTYRVTAF
jgi:hypothetical protein